MDTTTNPGAVEEKSLLAISHRHLTCSLDTSVTPVFIRAIKRPTIKTNRRFDIAKNVFRKQMHLNFHTFRLHLETTEQCTRCVSFKVLHDDSLALMLRNTYKLP